MDTGKQTIEANRRAAKSKSVSVKWCSTITIGKDGLYSWKKYFKILDGKKVKYSVKITSDGIYDSCSCPSFKFGMKYPLPEDQTVPFTSLYFAEHGHTFECKHIIACIVQKEKSSDTIISTTGCPQCKGNPTQCGCNKLLDASKCSIVESPKRKDEKK